MCFSSVSVVCCLLGGDNCVTNFEDRPRVGSRRVTGWWVMVCLHVLFLKDVLLFWWLQFRRKGCPWVGTPQVTQRGSSWYLQEAQVRAEINHFCGSRISTRSVHGIKKVAFAAHWKSTKIGGFKSVQTRILCNGLTLTKKWGNPEKSREPLWATGW